MSTKLSAEETFESLTGFDEIAISQAFKADVSDLAQNRATTFTRALYFVLLRRDGKSDTDAKKTALETRLGDVLDNFADEDDVDPSEPDSESGKDD